MAPPQLFNRVRQVVASAPSTGAIALGAAVSGYRTLAQAGATTGVVVNYVLEDGAAWEYGRGTWSSTGPTLSRTKILASSNSGAAINASASAIVSCDAFAEDVTNQFALISTSGDLSAAPVAAIIFTGLDAYTDLTFDFASVGHDYTTAAQTFSVSYSLDGSTFGPAAVISTSIGSTARNTGQCRLFGNGALRPVLQCTFTTGNSNNPPSLGQGQDRNIILFAGAPIVAVRFVPTTSGNFNTGAVNYNAR
ncbi:hypothetical protein [Methylobacterium sp. SD21]|uniref:hypothetical protein n=1 Tax=Methylobacterium litchii TaxID=3138810 RepID=UPI00313C66FD